MRETSPPRRMRYSWEARCRVEARRHDAERETWHARASQRAGERARFEAALRTVEIELSSLAPDAQALLDAFAAWGEPPDRWLA